MLNNPLLRDKAMTRNERKLSLQEDSENKLAVQEALSMMASAFRNIDSSNVKMMEALIMQNIEKVLAAVVISLLFWLPT